MTKSELKKRIGEKVDGVLIEQSRNCVMPVGHPCDCDVLAMQIKTMKALLGRGGEIVSVKVCKKGVPLSVEIEHDVS